MSDVFHGKFFTKQLAHAAGYSRPKSFTADILRHQLPIHPCGPLGFRDNLYSLSALARAIMLRRLKDAGIPVSRIGPYLAAIPEDEVETAAGEFLIRHASAIWCLLTFETASQTPRGLCITDQQALPCLAIGTSLVANISDELIRYGFALQNQSDD